MDEPSRYASAGLARLGKEERELPVLLPEARSAKSALRVRIVTSSY